MTFSKQLTILLLSILVFLFGCAYYNSLFNAKKNYNAGIEAILNSPDPTKTPASAKKYFETAIEKSWKLIDLYGDNSKWADDALLYISKSEYHLQKYTQSKVHLEQFMSKYPKSNLMDEVILWYAKALLQLDDYETANEYFLRAINNSKDAEIKSEAYFELGNYEYENENYEMAQEYFQKALKEKPNDQYRAALYFYLGETFYIQKDYVNAIKQYKKVEKYSPTLDIEYQTGLHLAKSYAYQEKYITGIKLLRKMLTAPRFKNFVPSIKTTIGEIYAQGGKYDDAVYIYRETIAARKSSPGTAQASLNLARLYETVYDDVDSAVVYYGKVKALYSRYDSVQIAEDKKVFLSELKDIRDAIHRDQRLVYKLTTDEFFRDSLFQAQYEDSIRRLSGDTLDTVLVENQPPPQPFWDKDSSQHNPADSAIAGNQPPGGQPGSQPGEPNPNPNEEEFGNGQQPPPIPGQEGTNPAGFEGPGSQNKNKKQKPEQKIIVIEVERRKLPQIEEDLKISRYQLAEYFLLKVENYDSAAFYFNKFVNAYDDSLLTPKALYSLRLIYTQEGYRDSLKVDSLENVILQRYPETVYSRQIKKERGLLQDEGTAEIVRERSHQLYLEAESLYYQQRLEDALTSYQQIAENDTISEWGAKALFATAWIYEHDLRSPDSALAAYEEIINRYPDATDYVAAARNKTTLLSALLAGNKAVLDSLTAPADTALTDSTAAIASRERQDVEIEASHIIEPEKVQWRMNRYLKHRGR